MLTFSTRPASLLSLCSSRTRGSVFFTLLWLRSHTMTNVTCRRVYWGSQFQGVRVQDGEARCRGRGRKLRAHILIHKHKAESVLGMVKGFGISSPASHDMLPKATPPKPAQTVPPNGNLVFKGLRLRTGSPKNRETKARFSLWFPPDLQPIAFPWAHGYP